MSALTTDFYTLTTAQDEWLAHREQGSDWQRDQVSFEYFVRRLPARRGFLVAAGIEEVLEILEQFQFTAEELAYLAERRYNDADPESPRRFDPGFIEFLGQLRFTGSVYGVKEGTVVYAQEPMLRITGPRITLTLIESELLAVVNSGTMWASKAARIVAAAQGRPVWDFGLRRAHGTEAGVRAARAGYIAGFTGTATAEAGMRYGIPVTGSMPHNRIMKYGEAREQEAFASWLRHNPHGTTVLLCTYDPRRGVERAIAAQLEVAAEFAGAGKPFVGLTGVRIDTDDLLGDSLFVRERLDAAGMTHVKIMASNDLDEDKITALLAAGAPIDIFGVGTAFVTSQDAPANGGVYKLVEQHELGEARYVMKRAGAKSTDPGTHQIYRRATEDVLALGSELIAGTALIHPLMTLGKRLLHPTLEQLRTHAAAELAQLPAESFDPAAPVPARTVVRSRKLIELRRALGDTSADQLAAEEPQNPEIEVIR